MPSFSSNPPKDTRGNSLQLVRTPTKGKLIGLITSTDLIGTATHFWHGRTVPHEEDDCRACQDNMPWRWHAWIACKLKSTRQHVLFEMTAQAAKTFVQYRDQHAGLRGAEFTAWRPSGKQNGRVSITIKPYDHTDVVLPLEPSLVEALSIIWNIATVDTKPGRPKQGLTQLVVNDRVSKLDFAAATPPTGNSREKK